MTTEDTTRQLQPPAPYAVEEAQRIEASKARLTAARSNIPVMRRNADIAHEHLTKILNDLQAETDLADRYAAELPYRVQALDLLCRENHWEPPAPAPVQSAASSTEQETAAFLASAPTTRRSSIVRYALPGAPRADGGAYCQQADCGAELIHVDGTWRHTATSSQECDPAGKQPPAAAEPGGALTEVMSKTRRAAA
jgi:hypothetical protein